MYRSGHQKDRFLFNTLLKSSFQLINMFFNSMVNDKGKLASQLIKGNGYEARQTSKEQTKMLRFMLEGA